MKILILGGHGFFGQNLVNAFRNTQHQIFPLSRKNGLNLADYQSTQNYFQDVTGLERLKKWWETVANRESVRSIANSQKFYIERYARFTQSSKA